MSSTRTRVKERTGLRTPVDTTDPAALAAYANSLRPVVASLRAGVEDATAWPSQRQRARIALRRDMLKSLRELEAQLDAAEHADLAGLGGAGPVA